MQYISVAYGEATPYPDIKKDNVQLLLKWADEYQMAGLVAAGRGPPGGSRREALTMALVVVDGSKRKLECVPEERLSIR